ncbi:hypothetical protein [Exiguobacterium sp. s155]|uniref:hypothetical protein n=1 Tax=Exiguobacterium sp. s155 TaxID=2751286 RepID=UPI001BE7DB25|nr:hypothetical protein [Exiguobacterium sp. s155]
MKKQYIQMITVLFFVVGISLVVLLNFTKLVETFLFNSQSEFIDNKEIEIQQNKSKSEVRENETKRDAVQLSEESLKEFAQNLGVPLKDMTFFNFNSREYSWANGYDESMVSYYEMMVKTNLYKETELIDYINAIARANYRMEKFRIKVLEEKGYNIVKWDENQDTFQYLSDYSRYSVAELYYKEFPEKRVDDQDSYYLNNALK